jgi:hypothetical protein
VNGHCSGGSRRTNGKDGVLGRSWSPLDDEIFARNGGGGCSGGALCGLNRSGKRKGRERRASPGTAKSEMGGVRPGMAHGAQGGQQHHTSGGGGRWAGGRGARLSTAAALSIP